MINKLDNEKRILIFGHGISLKYAYDEYNYEAIKQKFIEGIEITFNRKLTNSFSFIKIKDEIYSFVEEYKFNEKIFFELFKKLFIFLLEENYDLWKLYFNEKVNANKLWEMMYETVRKNEIGPTLFEIARISSLVDLFLKYSIGRSLIINKTWDNWIKINYENQFISFIEKSYCSIFTTNYYVDDLFDILKAKNKMCKYLHGQILKTKNFEWINKNSSSFSNENIHGTEISIYGNDYILYGSNYEDKVFMNSLNEWYWEKGNLKRREISFDYDENYFSNSKIDIIGLSIEGDKHIINEIVKKSIEINVYCFTKEDYLNWRNELINSLNKTNFYCSHEYEGFENKEKNDNCPRLCEIKLKK